MKKCTGAAHLAGLTGRVTKPGKSKFSEFQNPKISIFQIRLMRCQGPVCCILGLASFEELVLRRQEELCGPLQHCIITIIMSRDYKNRLGSVEQL